MLSAMTFNQFVIELCDTQNESHPFHQAIQMLLEIKYQKHYHFGQNEIKNRKYFNTTQHALIIEKIHADKEIIFDIQLQVRNMGSYKVYLRNIFNNLQQNLISNEFKKKYMFYSIHSTELGSDATQAYFWWIYRNYFNYSKQLRFEFLTPRKLLSFFKTEIEFLLNKKEHLMPIYQNLKTVIDYKNNWENLKYLKDKMFNEKLSLFVGAGVSIDANLPSWNTLIDSLRLEFLKENSNELNTLDQDDTMQLLDKFANTNNGFPLIETEIIKENFGEKKFIELLQKLLYRDVKPSELIKGIVRFVEINGFLGVKNVVSYNYDDLIEKSMKSRNMNYKPIYNEPDTDDPECIRIFHVHGFLPSDGNENMNNVVLTDEKYNELYNDTYHWTNITQIRFLLENTCLLVGQSGNDLNLRRILSITKKLSHNKHFIILKRVSFDSQKFAENKHIEIDHIEQKYNNALEHQFENLGVKVIWVNDYDDINTILDCIKF